MPRKQDAVVTFKTCPKCHGTGKVTCDGRDHFRLKYMAWAWKHHMKPVVYHGEQQDVPGIAVAGIFSGGWAYLDIYVALTNERMWPSYFNQEAGAYIHMTRRKKRGTKLEYQNFYIISCRGPDNVKVELLDYWPQNLMMLPSGYELDDGSLSNLIGEYNQANLLLG